jgi:hypothetical protein
MSETVELGLRTALSNLRSVLLKVISKEADEGSLSYPKV